MGQDIINRLAGIDKNYTMPRLTMNQVAEQLPYPKSAEPALIHPYNASTVKVRNNGVIDVFVGTNTGIRINPEDRSVSILAGTVTERATSAARTTVRDETHTVGRNWQVTVAGNASVKASGDLRLEAGGNVHISGRKIHTYEKE